MNLHLNREPKSTTNTHLYSTRYSTLTERYDAIKVGRSLSPRKNDWFFDRTFPRSTTRLEVDMTIR